MKIGILTYFRSHNYGSYLQGYALTNWLRLQKIDAELINFEMKKSADRFGKPKMGKDPFRYYYRLQNYKAFERNIQNAPTSGKLLISDDVEDLRKKIYGMYDLIIVGSDEVWRTDNFRGFPNPYFLIGDFGCPKVTYAISSLSDEQRLNSANYIDFVRAINDFSFITTRDAFTTNKIRKIVHIPVFTVCDPTFLYDFEIDKEKGRNILLKEYKIDISKKIVLFMNNDRQFALSIKHQLGKNVEVVAIYDYIRDFKNTLTADPFKWIQIIAGADFMITSYFHGTCFSLLGNTPFFSIDYNSPDKEHSKIYDLLNRIGLTNRFSITSEFDYVDKVIKECKKAFELNGNVDFSDKVQELKKLSKPFTEFLSDFSKGSK